MTPPHGSTRRRPEILHYRASPDEAAVIRAAARLVGRSPSSLMRDAALRAAHTIIRGEAVASPPTSQPDR